MTCIDRLAARMGIATGLVVVGDMVGEASSQERAVVGETLNLAARFQALAEPGAVVIRPETRHMLGEEARKRKLIIATAAIELATASAGLRRRLPDGVVRGRPVLA